MSFSLYVMIYYLFNGDDASAGKLQGSFGSLTAIATLCVIPLPLGLLVIMEKGKRFSLL